MNIKLLRNILNSVARRRSRFVSVTVVDRGRGVGVVSLRVGTRINRATEPLQHAV